MEEPPHRPRASERPRRRREGPRKLTASARRRQVRRRRAVSLALLGALVVVLLLWLWPDGTQPASRQPWRMNVHSPAVSIRKDGDGIKMATFLGTESRRFYGRGPVPQRLQLVWKTKLGGGWTEGIFGDDPDMYWSGTGWTGMPALIRDGGRLWLLIGGFNHNLHRMDAASGKIAWTYDFGDVIKGSPSVLRNPHPHGEDDRYLVLAGSRRGFGVTLDDPAVAPYRAIAFGSGAELWRLPEPRTACWSRDCDGSGFFLAGHQFIGLEDGWFYDLDPCRTRPWEVNGQTFRQPVVRGKRLLLGEPADAAAHEQRAEGANLVLESSPTLLGNTIFIASGAGHVYGLRRSDLAMVFDYRTGSDLDGTAVSTRDGKLLVPVEKQYISGHGGVLLLDPREKPRCSPVWYFPTGERRVAEWRGGVVGSVAVNDEYGGDRRYPPLAAFSSIDGYLYVVSQDTLADGTVKGPNGEPGLSSPRLIFKAWVNSSISTPIIVDNSIVAAAYDGRVHLYRITYTPAAKTDEGALRSRDGRWWMVSIRHTDSFVAGSAFESTPIVWDGRVYVGCRDGFFYCLGDR